MAAPRLYKPAEAGKLLGVHEQTVRRLVRDGHLRGVDMGVPGYPRLRIRDDDLEAFIETRTLDETA